MRKEPFAVGDYVHIVKRGAKKMEIVRDDNDCWRFLKILRHVNDKFLSEHWEEDLENNSLFGKSVFDRPNLWPEEKPLVMILAYTLLPNHFHILIKEVTEGGTAKFMQKLGNSMTGHFNLKYKETGSIFQGSYKAKCIKDNDYLRYLASYIMVKNVFELYPGGLEKAAQNFERAFDWGIDYKFSSLGDYTNILSKSSRRNIQNRPAQKIINAEILTDIFPSLKDFKMFAKDCILTRTLLLQVKPAKVE